MPPRQARGEQDCLIYERYYQVAHRLGLATKDHLSYYQPHALKRSVDLH